MLFGNNRNDIRQHFFVVWKKHNDKQTLDPMENLIANVIRLHPEYHSLLEDSNTRDKDFTPEMEQTNPFLHMGMHIALHEQLSTDRPTGIKDVYEKLQSKTEDIHETEHRMMECLGEAMWLAQRNNTLPDDVSYLECLKKWVGNI
ncbi:MAG: DUF1841 family protein [Gammaproteobacteria bacterium]|nr:DUF1841 family protein [Gammaproteobacteria bacterium]